MQVINFANPISPAQRSWVQEGGNFLLVATSLFCPLPTPPSAILDFSRFSTFEPIVESSRPGEGSFRSVQRLYVSKVFV